MVTKNVIKSSLIVSLAFTHSLNDEHTWEVELSTWVFTLTVCTYCNAVVRNITSRNFFTGLCINYRN